MFPIMLLSLCNLSQPLVLLPKSTCDYCVSVNKSLNCVEFEIESCKDHPVCLYIFSLDTKDNADLHCTATYFCVDS